MVPILFKNSGGIPEYCDGFGVGIDKRFEEALDEIINNFKTYKSNLINYPFNSENMSKEILSLMNQLLEGNDYYESKNFKSKIIFLTKQKFIKWYIKLDSSYKNFKSIIKQIILKLF